MMGKLYLFQGFKNQPNILPEANSRLSTILPGNSVSTKCHFCAAIASCTRVKQCKQRVLEKLTIFYNSVNVTAKKCTRLYHTKL